MAALRWGLFLTAVIVTFVTLGRGFIHSIWHFDGLWCVGVLAAVISIALIFIEGTPADDTDHGAHCLVDHTDASEDELLEQNRAHNRAALLMWLDGQIDVLDSRHLPRHDA